MKHPAVRRNIREVANAKRQKRRDELIEQFKKGWGVSGAALQELKDDEHWKDTHTSWIDFCKDTFGISKTKLYNLLKYTEIVGSLSKENQPKITTVEQALILGKLPSKDRNKIVDKASSNGGITADNLKFHSAKPARARHVTDRAMNSPESGQSSSESTESKPPQKPKTTPKEKPKIEFDENGTPIPSDALVWWEKAWGEEHKDDVRVQEVLSEISRLKSIVVGGRENKEKRWLKVTNSIADTFDSLRSLISEAKPYAVCTTCMGTPSLQKDGCNFCRSTGLISKWQWDTQSRKEIKDIVLLRAADIKKEMESENVH